MRYTDSGSATYDMGIHARVSIRFRLPPDTHLDEIE